MAEGIILNIPPKAEPTLHAIAYLDLLGTTTKIAHDEHDHHLFSIYAIYNMAVQSCVNERLSGLGFNKIKTKIFSDNIIMAIPLESEYDIDAICCLLKFVSQFQNYASITYNWLVRGGVTIGNLFLDELLVWGSGLVRSYELENHIAIYPRIVIDRNVLDLIGEDGPFFRCDIDGQFFLNYLNFMRYRDANGNDNFVPTVQRSFSAQLSEIILPNGTYKERPYQKLQWHKNYINSWYKENHPQSNIIPICD